MASTTLTSWALLIWQTLRDKGFDPQQAFAEAGLDSNKLGDGNARYPIAGMQRLWQKTEEITGDETFGLEIGKNWNATTFHALGYAWLASSSLKEAMQRFARYARLVNNSLEVRVTSQGPTYRFSITSPEIKKSGHPMGIDTYNMAFLKMCRLLCGNDFRPLEIHALRPRNAYGSLYESQFQAPYLFESTDNCWVIDCLDAERILPTGNAALVQVNEELALKYLATVDQSNISKLVQKIITESLPSGPVTQQQVAKELKISIRSLQRKLEADGYRYSALMANTRRDLADTYIRNSQLSLSEIAYLLGFAEPASFTRAFRRWNGTSPSEFRRSFQELSMAV